jgi:hypothetical protein
MRKKKSFRSQSDSDAENSAMNVVLYFSAMNVVLYLRLSHTLHILEDFFFSNPVKLNDSDNNSRFIE